MRHHNSTNLQFASPRCICTLHHLVSKFVFFVLEKVRLRREWREWLNLEKQMEIAYGLWLTESGDEIEALKSPLSCRIEGPLFDTGFSCSAPSVTAQGLHQVAPHMHNPNGIFSARSVSQLAPDSVASMGKECVYNSTSLSSHCNQK